MAIKGALKEKCVVLVTHQLQFLRQAEKVLVLRDGIQDILGNFDEITAKGFNVDEILLQYSQTTHKAIEYQKEIKAAEDNKQRMQLQLVRKMTEVVSERDYVAATMLNKGKGSDADSYLLEEERKLKK